MTTSVLPRPAAPALTVRKALAAPAADHRHLMRAVRSAVVRQSLAFGAVFVFLCLCLVWVQHRVDDVGRQLWEAHKLLERLDHERSELTLERETLKDHARVAEYARDKLGLVPPRKGQLIEVR
jgi:cell division protein FtsL